ncbi:B- and T-lymphocyte attenuator-like isoform X3 [Sebastes umbrosus]|uniref:B- and T-lymphocyte attenuator-like isoform X2 n=1 Tax=Sebastes umbrosus TaxID=72105 RepID=UPI0018A08061|nr:B- and T-lymphocyte attenuator-like isoform X2 [Sebastes umbrosus]XP_037618261.1 B- and T-lymphocyte attenuator-like isoform X3 [Sebastes umbrosus]
MRPNYCLTILHVSIFAALLITLDADGDEYDCEVELKVHRNTIYGAILGEDLEIDCTVAFCNYPPPTVSWDKLDKTFVPVNVSSSSHIKTEWKLSDDLEGKSILIFQKILRSDSGVYQCGDGSSVSHNINVTVHDDGMRTNVTQTTSKPETIEYSWRFVYHVVRITLFVILVITFCVASMCGCKGKSRDTPSRRRQPSHDALPTTHIYDNVRLSAL